MNWPYRPVANDGVHSSSVSIRVFLCLCFVICSSASVEPVRWWWSRSILEGLQVTPEQRRSIEQVYQANLPASTRAGEEVMEITAAVAERLRDGKYDAELLSLTSRLVTARREQVERRRQVLAETGTALSPRQRHALLRLIRDKRIME